MQKKPQKKLKRSGTDWREEMCNRAQSAWTSPGRPEIPYGECGFYDVSYRSVGRAGWFLIEGFKPSALGYLTCSCPEVRIVVGHCLTDATSRIFYVAEVPWD